VVLPARYDLESRTPDMATGLVLNFRCCVWLFGVSCRIFMSAI
jgi:hypothetical protein